jgi:hypothetical protein
VQTGKEGKENDYGVVSDGHGFEDSPDCERISGGVNSKGPAALAIGRQANMLQWGFYCAPDRMTGSARRVFLNAIVWMRQFDGQQPLVKKTSRSRDWLRQYAKMLADLPAEQRQQNGEGTYGGYLRGQFPKDLTGGDDEGAKVNAWLDANLEYMTSADHKYSVDEDLAAWKVSNRKPELFRALIDRLRKEPADAAALRVARRYLPDAKADAASIEAFVAQNEGRLFFSDLGGYRWFVGPERPAAAK